MIKNYASHQFEGFNQKDKGDFKNGIKNLLGDGKEIDLSESELEDLVKKIGVKNVYDNKELLLFDKNQNRLIELTKIDSFKKLLVDELVENFESIIAKDIQGKYTDLKEKIIKGSSAVRELQENAISMSRNKDLSRQIQELSEQIEQSKNSIIEIKKLFKKTTESIQNASDQVINAINFKNYKL
jgi:methyl-accepting chemotaxis protein